MALLHQKFNELASNPNGLEALDYINTAFLTAGWIQDKIVYGANGQAIEIYFHNTHATATMYVSASLNEGDVNYQQVWFYNNLGFDDALAVDAQPDSLSTYPNPAPNNSTLFGRAGIIDFECFSTSEAIYFTFYQQLLLYSGGASTAYVNSTSQMIYMAGTLVPYSSYTGGQFCHYSYRGTDAAVTIYDGCYFNGQWYFSDANKVNGVDCGTGINLGSEKERAGNRRTGGIVMYPYVMYVDLEEVLADTKWAAIGEFPFMFWQRYGVINNKTYVQDGITYYCKTYGDPASYKYHLFQVPTV